VKIAFFVDKFPSSSETFVLNQITGLLGRGHEIDVYANSKGDFPWAHSDLIGYALEQRTYYLNHGLQKMPAHKLIRLIKAIRVIYECWKTGEKKWIKSLNVVKYGKRAASLELLFRSVLLMGKGFYDIVHCHFGLNGEIAAALKEIGVLQGKVITTFHGYDITSYIKENGHDVYNFLFVHGDLFLTISERWKHELIRLGCRTEKIIVHKMGVNLKQLVAYTRRAESREQVRVLSVGRFIEKKGFEYGIRAVAKVVKKYPNVEYQIVGDGKLRGELTELIEQLEVYSHIQLVGWKSQEDVARLLKSVDIFLAPSVTGADGDQEGIPVVLMEALACGLPVISTFHSGIPELIQDRQSGFLVQERDAVALAEKLEYLAAHPEVGDNMGKTGRAWVEKHHNINQLNEQLVKIFERVLCGEVTGKETRHRQRHDSARAPVITRLT